MENCELHGGHQRWRERMVANSSLRVTQITKKPKLAAPPAQKGAIFRTKTPNLRPIALHSTNNRSSFAASAAPLHHQTASPPTLFCVPLFPRSLIAPPKNFRPTLPVISRLSS
jgi:hypothetical protein